MIDLAIGMTTAARPVPTADESVRSLRFGGFDQPIHLFAEPAALVSEQPGSRIRRNDRTLGIVGNWLHAARTLLHESDASHLLLCQDDIRLCRGAAIGLAQAIDSLPPGDWGYASLYTPQHNVDGIVPSLGWQSIDLGINAWGALAYCFTRRSLSEFLHSPVLLLNDRPIGIDWIVSHAAQKLGLKLYFHLPSLCEHNGHHNSTIDHYHNSASDAVDFDVDFVPSPTTAAAGDAERNGQALPLVSCMLVTGDRREFALQAVEYFLRQTYSPRELVIIDDGHDGLSHCLPDDERIRYESVPVGHSTGEKRNLACELTRGKFIAFWDDDDWHGPDRLQRQLRPLLSGEADITTLRNPVCFDLAKWSFRRCRPELQDIAYGPNGHPGTMVFVRSIWERFGKFPDLFLGEDNGFLRGAISRGARIHPIEPRGCYVYVRHGQNTCRFPANGSYWIDAIEPGFYPADRAFYRRRRAILRGAENAFAENTE